MDLKRCFDIAVSATALTVLSPVLLAVAAATTLRFGRAPLFFIDRLGRDGETFSMYKFYSLPHITGPDGTLLPDKDRMTGFGRFLRVTSLDELPQLVNILKGDMSLVGPRPRRLDEAPPAAYAAILSVRPGLTGPWQVATIGRADELEGIPRLRLDNDYATAAPSLWRDIKIILNTPKTFLLGHNGEIAHRKPAHG